MENSLAVFIQYYIKTNTYSQNSTAASTFGLSSTSEEVMFERVIFNSLTVRQDSVFHSLSQVAQGNV